MKKKNGFTLIELLAVIIILGILMIIAVPAVTRYINESRKDSYVHTAKNIAGGARNLTNSGSMDLSDTETTYYIEGQCVKSENGYKSPYGDFEKAYVVVVATDEGHDYYWVSVDTTGTGVKSLTKVDDLVANNIEGDINSSEITPTIGIDGRSQIVIVGGDNCDKGSPIPAEKMMNGKTGKIKDACPAVTETIYWALQDTNNDSKADKLVLSDSSVSGLDSGSFAGNTIFGYDSPPWSNNNDYEYITDIEVVGNIVPLSTESWFNSAGYYSSTLRIDVSNLNVCNVTSLRAMFGHSGSNASVWEIDGIEDFDTSNVTNMAFMFNNTGANVNSYSLDLSGWDTSKVTTMFYMFSSTASNAQSFNLNLSNWKIAPDAAYMFSYAGQKASSFGLNLTGSDTSKTTDMKYMFYESGRDATTWSIQGIENWNTSNVESFYWMFYDAGQNSSTFNFDLSRWNTSKVKDMTRMFGYAGEKSQTFNLNLSGWDLSKVTSIYGMFYNTGEQASTYTLNVSNWNTLNFTDICEVFGGRGRNATTFTLNASNWDTSNVTQMYGTFYQAGQNATTVNINISGWTTANVTNIENMFNEVGENATNFNVIIPRTNGNGVNNTTTTIHGKTTNYSSSLPSGKTFTFAN